MGILICIKLSCNNSHLHTCSPDELSAKTGAQLNTNKKKILKQTCKRKSTEMFASCPFYSSLIFTDLSVWISLIYMELMRSVFVLFCFVLYKRLPCGEGNGMVSPHAQGVPRSHRKVNLRVGGGSRR